jgi:hypothetical protein
MQAQGLGPLGSNPQEYANPSEGYPTDDPVSISYETTRNNLAGWLKEPCLTPEQKAAIVDTATLVQLYLASLTVQPWNPYRAREAGDWAQIIDEQITKIKNMRICTAKECEDINARNALIAQIKIDRDALAQLQAKLAPIQKEAQELWEKLNPGMDVSTGQQKKFPTAEDAKNAEASPEQQAQWQEQLDKLKPEGERLGYEIETLIDKIDEEVRQLHALTEKLDCPPPVEKPGGGSGGGGSYRPGSTPGTFNVSQNSSQVCTYDGGTPQEIAYTPISSGGQVIATYTPPTPAGGEPQ